MQNKFLKDASPTPKSSPCFKRTMIDFSFGHKLSVYSSPRTTERPYMNQTPTPNSENISQLLITNELYG
jgi:hypothetical protein